MIANWLVARGRELPLGRDESGRFLPWVVALMIYVAGLGGVGLIVLEDMRRATEHAFATALTLQIPADASNARLETVMALLRQTQGIVSVRLLEPAETARLLEPWLGPSAPLDELPVPRLIDLRVDPSQETDIATLRQRLASVLPDARLDDHRPSPPEMHVLARRIEGVLAASITLALTLIAVSTAFAVRTALMAHRSPVELLHVLGATDAEITRGFAIRSLRRGLLGGVVGAVAALATIVTLDGAGSLVQLPAPAATKLVADWRVWGILSSVVPAAGLIAMASTWAAVMRRLACMP